MQHPKPDVRTWQTKVVRREVADWRGRADFRAAIEFMHQRSGKAFIGPSLGRRRPKKWAENANLVIA